MSEGVLIGDEPYVKASRDEWIVAMLRKLGGASTRPYNGRTRMPMAQFFLDDQGS